MPTIQIEADLSPEQLLNAARQLPRREFDRFVSQVLRLRAERIAPSLSATESELLMKINQGLPPAMQERLNELIKKTPRRNNHCERVAGTEKTHRSS